MLCVSIVRLRFKHARTHKTHAPRQPRVTSTHTPPCARKCVYSTVSPRWSLEIGYRFSLNARGSLTVSLSVCSSETPKLTLALRLPGGPSSPRDALRPLTVNSQLGLSVRPVIEARQPITTATCLLVSDDRTWVLAPRGAPRSSRRVSAPRLRLAAPRSSRPAARVACARPALSKLRSTPHATLPPSPPPLTHQHPLAAAAPTRSSFQTTKSIP